MALGYFIYDWQLLALCSIEYLISATGKQEIYHQNFIYSPTDALANCLKNNIKIYIKVYAKTVVLIQCKTILKLH